MKWYINSVVKSCSVLAASASLAAAQDAQSSQNTIVVGAGNDLRCRLEKGLRITKSGEPITAKLVEPVYAGAPHDVNISVEAIHENATRI
jgi:hypothetical protein